MTFIKISYSESAYSTPYSLWKHTCFEYSLICLTIFVNNNNKYSYYKCIYAKFEISILVYL